MASKMSNALATVLAYTLWLASAGVTLWLMLWIRIVFLVELPWKLLRADSWRLESLDRFGTFVLGAAWLFSVIISEPYFTKWPQGKRSLVDVLKVLLGELILLGVVYGIHLLL